jgi:S1-C subfamily serine protease
VSKDLIVTNCHVIEGAPETAEITVRSKYLSEILNVRVLATECTDEEEIGRGPDFALLQVSKPPSKPVEPLKIAKETKIPNKIWAFGYPANTFAYQTIKENEVPTPALIPTDGRVEGVFLNADGKTNEGVDKKMTEVIQHSGEISGGNSGGPLIDLCGNVVGVNTFGYRDEIGETPRKYALSSRMLRSFLVSQDVDYEATDMCPPNRVLSDENILEIAERSVVYVEWLKSQE